MLGVFGGYDMLHVGRARRQQGRRSAFRRDGVKMLPAVMFPREDETIARAPEELALRDHGVKHAARAGLRFPDLPPRAVSHRGHTDRPWLTRASRSTRDGARGSHAHERDLPTVLRPH